MCAPSVIYLKQKYSTSEHYKDIKTVFTIHNIQYQGKFGLDSMSDVFDLVPSDYETVEYGGSCWDFFCNVSDYLAKASSTAATSSS